MPCSSVIWGYIGSISNNLVILLADLTLAFYKHESYPGSNEINSKSLVKVLRSLGENPSSKEVMDMANELDQGIVYMIDWRVTIEGLDG